MNGAVIAKTLDNKRKGRFIKRDEPKCSDCFYLVLVPFAFIGVGIASIYDKCCCCLKKPETID